MLVQASGLAGAPAADDPGHGRPCWGRRVGERGPGPGWGRPGTRRARAARAMRRWTWGPVTARLTWRPSVRARLYAPIRACRPAESQNRVRVMSTTTAGPGRRQHGAGAPA